MLITGYFYSPKAVLCQFDLYCIHDLAYVNMGAGNALKCYEKDTLVQYPGNFTQFAEWILLQASEAVQVNVVRGPFYPIRLFYAIRD